MEIKKNPFGETAIYWNGIQKGKIAPNGDIIDMFGQTIGQYAGGNYGVDKHGFKKELEDIFHLPKFLN